MFDAATSSSRCSLPPQPPTSTAASTQRSPAFDRMPYPPAPSGPVTDLSASVSSTSLPAPSCRLFPSLALGRHILSTCGFVFPPPRLLGPASYSTLQLTRRHLLSTLASHHVPGYRRTFDLMLSPLPCHIPPCSLTATRCLTQRPASCPLRSRCVSRCRRSFDITLSLFSVASLVRASILSLLRHAALALLRSGSSAVPALPEVRHSACSVLHHTFAQDLGIAVASTCRLFLSPLHILLKSRCCHSFDRPIKLFSSVSIRGVQDIAVSSTPWSTPSPLLFLWLSQCCRIFDTAFYVLLRIPLMDGIASTWCCKSSQAVCPGNAERVGVAVG